MYICFIDSEGGPERGGGGRSGLTRVEALAHVTNIQTYTHIYIYIYTDICVNIYIYIY